MNAYIFVDFCERDTRTRRVSSVRLAHARPNNQFRNTLSVYVIKVAD